MSLKSNLNNLTQQTDWQKRTVIVLICVILLGLNFIFQKADYFSFIISFFGSQVSSYEKFTQFAFNKTFRFLINDVLTIFIIYGIFYEKKYVVIAIFVQLFGLFMLLPSYLVFKYFNPSYNGALINFLHRITLNPILLLMLIPLFFYQRKLNSIEQ